MPLVKQYWRFRPTAATSPDLTVDPDLIGNQLCLPKLRCRLLVWSVQAEAEQSGDVDDIRDVIRFTNKQHATAVSPNSGLTAVQ